MTAADVDRARTEERSLIRTWAMRSTMHLLAADDVGWMVPFFEPAMTATSRKRLVELGMEPREIPVAERAIREALGRDGALSRDELTALLAAKGIELRAEKRMHLFRLAVTSGWACLGPDKGGRSCLVLSEDWLGPRPKHDRDAGLRELALRYLRAFGPATAADFAGWAGLPLRDIRAGLSAIGGLIREVRIGEKQAWALKGRARAVPQGTLRLLPGWDTYLMGYRERDFIAEGEDWKRLMPGGGMLRPTVLIDGAAVGTWGVKRGKGKIDVRVEAFPGHQRLLVGGDLEKEVADIGRFEGLEASISLK